MKNVLLIAGLGERYYFDSFVKECKKRGKVKIFIFDPSCFPKELSISITMGREGQIDGFIDVLECEDEDTKRVRLSISDINIAWYLRDGIANRNKQENSIEDRFARNESRAMLQSLFSVLKCNWVNQKANIDLLASNKLYQQMIAGCCGLLTPKTLVSNDYGSVVSFSDPKEGLLLKSIGYIKLDDDRRFFLYSERFGHKELSVSSKAIQRCPVFCQEYVEKHYEYRIMVIGNRILSCRIDSQASEKTKTDWRHYDFGNVEHLQVELPKDVQQKLMSFMETIGLRYGAIDMIETPAKDFIFLEVNPSGQWGWIADIAGLPIPEAVAEMLESL